MMFQGLQQQSTADDGLKILLVALFVIVVTLIVITVNRPKPKFSHSGQRINRNKKPPQTWDYSYRGADRDYILKPIDKAKRECYVVAWGDKVDDDDYLLFLMDGKTVRYHIVSMAWYDFPFGFWAAYIARAPRPGEKVSSGGGGRDDRHGGGRGIHLLEDD